MKFENTKVDGFQAAFRGMRNPLNSWTKSDSQFGIYTEKELHNHLDEVANTYGPDDSMDRKIWLDDNGCLAFNQNKDAFQYALIGKNDLGLAQRLLGGNAADSKFMRQINVSVDITAPSYWLAELDTYKINTTRDSTSLQHKGMSRDYVPDDFTIDEIKLIPFSNGTTVESTKDLQTVIDIINKYRQLYKQTKDYHYFRVMRQLMPMGYNYTITWSSNYAGLRNMYFQRKNHALTEWREDFCSWVRELPYGQDLIAYTVH